MCMDKGDGRVCMFFSVLILEFQSLPPFFHLLIFLSNFNPIEISRRKSDWSLNGRNVK